MKPNFQFRTESQQNQSDPAYRPFFVTSRRNKSSVGLFLLLSDLQLGLNVTDGNLQIVSIKLERYQLIFIGIEAVQLDPELG